MLAPALAVALSLASSAEPGAPPAAAVGAPVAAVPEVHSGAIEVPEARPEIATLVADAAGARLAARSDEAMEFSVSYLGIPLGKARLFVGTVEPNVAPVFLQARTSSVLSFITIRQQLATYLDVETGLPRWATLDAVEGSYRHTDTVHFDRVANKATVHEKGKSERTHLVDVPPGTLDFVGLVFRLRQLPLEPGFRQEFSVLAGRRLKTVTAEVVGREKVSTEIGEFQALKVRVPTGFSGKFSEKNPTHVWLSDDERRIVVRITTDFSVGHATASLVSYKPGVPPVETSPAPGSRTRSLER